MSVGSQPNRPVQKGLAASRSVETMSTQLIVPALYDSTCGMVPLRSTADPG
jgi:hypothetical protein